MNHQLKLRAVFALVAFLLAAACSNDSNQNRLVTTTTNTVTSNTPPAAEVKQRGTAWVRVIHAVPGGPPVDVLAGDTKVFSGVTYKTNSPYEEVSVGRHTFRIRPAGQNTAQPLAENGRGLGDGKRYTVVAWAGENGEPALSILDDDLSQPSSGKTHVRLIHASADAGEVDLYAREGNKRLLGGVDFRNATTYGEFNPVSGAIEVRPAGKNTAVLSIPNVKFEAGDVYTIVVVGRAKGAPKLEAMIVEDKLVGASTSASSENADGNVNGNADSNSNKY